MCSLEFLVCTSMFDVKLAINDLFVQFDVQLAHLKTRQRNYNELNIRPVMEFPPRFGRYFAHELTVGLFVGTISVSIRRTIICLVYFFFGVQV